MSRYGKWISENVNGDGYGDCEVHAKALADEFPGLRVAAGFYHCPSWGRRTHWWCVTQSGEIADPTATQFPSGGCGRYEELDLTSGAARARIPTGVCMDCGEPVYGGVEFCSSECRTATIAYLGLNS